MKRDLASLTGTNPAQVTASGDDFVARIQQTIKQFKGLLDAAKELQGLRPAGKVEAVSEAKPHQSSQLPAPTPPKTPGIVQYLDLAIAGGYGDKTIGEILKALDAVKLKEVREIMKNVTRT